MHAPRSESSRQGVWAPLLLTAAVLVLDLTAGEPVQFVGVLTAMPLLAAALTGPLSTALVGVLVAGAAFGFGFLQQAGDATGPAAMTTVQLARVGFVLAATVLGVAVARSRTQRAARFRRVATVADAAQRAVLRPIPSSVGPVDCASTYVSATTEASIGGDLVEVLDTPFGVRAVVGDVRGKGLDAVRLAGQVLGSFREVAWTVPDLADVAVPLDRAVRRDAGPEDFVTAALVQVTWDGTVTTCTCGHPPPFVVRPESERAEELDVDPAPPLGLLDGPPPATVARITSADRLVLVTDGLLEARRPRRLLDRRSGQFLDAEDVLGRCLGTGPLALGLDAVVTEVRRWTRGRMRDDLALLALRVRPTGRRRDRFEVPDQRGRHRL